MVVIAKKFKSTDKIVHDHRLLGQILEGLKSQGKTVVFTDGSFDPLGVDHVRRLEDAKSRGDYLVVAVRSEKHTKVGRARASAATPETERMEVLAFLHSVDYVTKFEQETADEILMKLRPTLVAKGHAFTEKTVPERATVKELGAKIVIVGDKRTAARAVVAAKARRQKA
jgi:rfaE bifunctional protein nucleotidyltransferase chain/domain